MTETWLKDSDVTELSETLSEGSGLGPLVRNREPNNNGVSYGGVAVVWRKKFANFSEVKLKLKNEGRFEVLTASGSIKGHRRKLVVLACYIPPGYCRPSIIYVTP